MSPGLLYSEDVVANAATAAVAAAVAEGLQVSGVPLGVYVMTVQVLAGVRCNTISIFKAKTRMLEGQRHSVGRLYT
jgi:uncharacterized protein (DUF2062 family)